MTDKIDKADALADRIEKADAGEQRALLEELVEQMMPALRVAKRKPRPSPRWTGDPEIDGRDAGRRAGEVFAASIRARRTDRG